MMVKRFTTLVMATRPTFWEKEVSGGHPNREDIAEEYPSHAREPWISSPVISPVQAAGNHGRCIADGLSRRYQEDDAGQTGLLFQPAPAHQDDKCY